MESQQIVDYIREHLGAGHTEASLRDHLQKYGWSESATNDAFARYHQSGDAATAAVPLTPAAKRKRYRVKEDWWRSRWVKAGAALVVVAALAMGLHSYVSYRAAHKVIPPPPPLTYQQKQSVDVNNLGGAVGQYALTNGAIPTSLSVSQDGNLVLCSTVCDPTTSEVVPMSVYKAADVKLVAFALDLAVPDSRTMYLVPGANCKGAGHSLTASENSRAMAILYAPSSDTSLAQRCVTL